MPAHSQMKFKNGLLQAILLFLVVLFTTTTSTAQNPLKDNSPGCSCYTTSGPSAAYFTYHRFHDFRAFPRRQVYIPPPVADDQDSGNETSTNAFFDSTLWTADWRAQSWAKNATSDAPVRLVNSLQNVYIGQDQPYTPTYLALRTTRLPTFQSTAEIESLQKNVLHASIRLRARVYGNPGAVAGLFLYYTDSCESDVEILTSDPATHVRYSNQPSVDAAGDLIDAASDDVRLPDGVRWTGWNEHRIDWLPGRSAWYVNGVSVANMSYGVPQLPSGLIVNLWSDGGVWSRDMEVGGEASLQIQWVEMVFNTSGPVTGPEGATTTQRTGRRWAGGVGELQGRSERERESGCRVPCTVDGVERVGWPEYGGGRVSEIDVVVNEDRARGTVPLGLLGTLAVAAVGDVEVAFAVLLLALAASFVVGV